MRREVTAVVAWLAVAGCGAGSDPEGRWPYHEVSSPQGAPAGTVLYFHGGNWRTGRELVEETEPRMSRFTRAGWRAVSVDYSPDDPLGSALRWYDRLERTDGPLCVAGASAGAQLALMVAARRSPDCVIANGAPVDLTGQTPLDPDVAEGAAQAFGRGSLRAVSPLHSAGKLDAPILLGHFRDDDVVPLEQSRRMKRAADARLHVIDGPGPASFVHADDGAEADDVLRYERAILKHLNRAAR